MSRIAIIDTKIDPAHIGGMHIDFINLCDTGSNACRTEISHGTLCAMVLDHCAKKYELINIQIFNNKTRLHTDLELLARAFIMCNEMNIDIVSLSAGTTILSDSRYIYDITNTLAETSIIVSALDNRRFVTIPTNYPHVIGVQSDIKGLLSPGELAYNAGDPFDACLYSNCDFELLRKMRQYPSNSFAVPVAVAYINDLINKGGSIKEIKTQIQNLKTYPNNNAPEQTVKQTTSDIPLVFFAVKTIDLCRDFMDCLYDKHFVQSSAIALFECPYDVRIKVNTDITRIRDDMRFMEHHYKTDLIFIVGAENQSEKVRNVAEIDVWLSNQSEDKIKIDYEDKRETCNLNLLPDRLHEILTA